jgi:hypothetical protein
VRVRFTSIDSGGVEARAFLLFSSRDVEIHDHACGGRELVATARLSRGPVRSVLIRFATAAAGEVPNAVDGCPRGSVAVTVEDGTSLSGGTGTVTVESLRLRPGGVTYGRFSYTTNHAGRPITVRGTFAIPIR